MHTSIVGIVRHGATHDPQWLLLVMVSTHAPAQNVWPVGHVQLPPMHTRPPVQLLPHEPQLAASVIGSTQALSQRRVVGAMQVGARARHARPLSGSGVLK